MLIEPNSTLYLCFGVPLNPTYDGTLTFANATEQFNYFQGQALFGAMTELSYQRYDDGAITVEMPINHLYSCNYMVFRNIEFSNRWFYAFVNKVEYVSNEVTKIYYTIDILQTWMFDWEFGNCYIDREHVNDDTIGSNTLPEPFPVGNFILNRQGNLCDYSGFGLVIASYADLYFETDVNGNFIQNVSSKVWIDTEIAGTLISTPFVRLENTVSNLVYNYIPFTTKTEKSLAVQIMKQLLVGDFWNSFNKYVVSVSVVPLTHLGKIRLGENESYSSTHRRTRQCEGYGEIYGNIQLMSPDYYYPTCKKLYTEQFMQVKLSGVNGISTNLPYDSIRVNQNGDQLYIPMKVEGGVYNGCGYRASPAQKDSDYSGRAMSLDTGAIHETSFTASDRINVIGNMILAGLTSAVKTFGSVSVKQMPAGDVPAESQSTAIMPYNPYVAAMNDTPPPQPDYRDKFDNFGDSAWFAAKNIVGYGLPIIAKVMGIKGRGIPATPSADSYMIDTLNDVWNFYYEVYTPNKKDLRSIDVYLNTFGYASNRVGKPNTNTRERWNYVKLKWCNFSRANMSADVIAQVKSIFERGVFLWHGAENVNNYVNVNGTPIKNEVINNA